MASVQPQNTLDDQESKRARRETLDKVLEEERLEEEEEMEKQAHEEHWIPMLDPRWKWRKRWDLLIMIFILYNAAGVPINLAFKPESLLDTYINNVGDTLFMLDILISFRTGYVQKIGAEERLYMDVRHVTTKYLKGWFVIDVLSVGVPYGLLEDMVPADIAEFANAFAMLKMLRLLRLGRLLSRLIKIPVQALNVARIFKLVVVFTFVAHVTGSMFYWLARMEGRSDFPGSGCGLDGNRTCTWINDAGGLATTNFATQYITSLYWAMMTATTVGYGDITIVNNGEKIYATIIMLACNMMGAVIFGNVTNLVQSLDSENSRHREKIEMIEEFIECNNIDEELAERLRETIEFQWDLTKFFDMNAVLNDMPDSLAVETLLYIHADFIMKVPFFQDCDEAFIKSVVVFLRPQVCLDYDIIFNEGDAAETMYFLKKGLVEVLAPHSDAVLDTLRDGFYFGEFGLLVDHGRRMMTARATDRKCEFYTLSRENLDSVFESFPTNQISFREVALERLANLVKKRTAVTMEDQTEGRVVLEIVKGRALSKNPHMDTYIVVKLININEGITLRAFKTKVVEEDNFPTYQAVFNFHFVLHGDQTLRDLKFAFEIYQHRHFAVDALIGTLEVDLLRLVEGDSWISWHRLSEHSNPSMIDLLFSDKDEVKTRPGELLLKFALHEESMAVERQERTRRAFEQLGFGQSLEELGVISPSKDRPETPRSKSPINDGQANVNTKQLAQNLDSSMTKMVQLQDALSKIESSIRLMSKSKGASMDPSTPPVI